MDSEDESNKVCLDDLLDCMEVSLEKEDIIYLEENLGREDGEDNVQSICSQNQVNCNRNMNEVPLNNTDVYSDMLQPIDPDDPHELTHGQSLTDVEASSQVNKSQRTTKGIPGQKFVSYESFPASKEKTFTCELCGLRLATRESRRRHILSKHIKERTNFCNECGRAFIFKFALKSHKATHADTAKFVCICGQSFSIRSSYNDHVRRIHQAAPNVKYQCELCFKTFGERATLRIHLISVHKPKTIPCLHKGCPKLFSTIGLMRSHYRYHLKQKFACDECGQVFSTEAYMYKHRLSHSGTSFYSHFCIKITFIYFFFTKPKSSFNKLEKVSNTHHKRHACNQKTFFFLHNFPHPKLDFEIFISLTNVSARVDINFACRTKIDMVSHFWPDKHKIMIQRYNIQSTYNIRKKCKKFKASLRKITKNYFAILILYYFSPSLFLLLEQLNNFFINKSLHDKPETLNRQAQIWLLEFGMLVNGLLSGCLAQSCTRRVLHEQFTTTDPITTCFGLHYDHSSRNYAFTNFAFFLFLLIKKGNVGINSQILKLDISFFIKIVKLCVVVSVGLKDHAYIYCINSRAPPNQHRHTETAYIYTRCREKNNYESLNIVNNYENCRCQPTHQHNFLALATLIHATEQDIANCFWEYCIVCPEMASIINGSFCLLLNQIQLNEHIFKDPSWLNILIPSLNTCYCQQSYAQNLKKNHSVLRHHELYSQLKAILLHKGNAMDLYELLLAQKDLAVLNNTVAPTSCYKEVISADLSSSGNMASTEISHLSEISDLPSQLSGSSHLPNSSPSRSGLSCSYSTMGSMASPQLGNMSPLVSSLSSITPSSAPGGQLVSQSLCSPGGGSSYASQGLSSPAPLSLASQGSLASPAPGGDYSQGEDLASIMGLGGTSVEDSLGLPGTQDSLGPQDTLGLAAHLDMECPMCGNQFLSGKQRGSRLVYACSSPHCIWNML
ncbi:unnamed protein product, partial [Meganyctiphanes norvegica]